MNKRARNRLLGVTAILLLAIAAIFFSLQNSGTTAYYKSVKEIATDKTLVGERVKVGGAVVAGSWDKKSNPMSFEIRDEKDTAGKGETVEVIYNGPVPSTFGDGVTAIVTGEMSAIGEIQAGEMITKCPSKYESASGAMSVAAIKKGEKLAKIDLTGFVKTGSIKAPGSGARFVLTGSEAGDGEPFDVLWEGALPAGMADGSQVVLKGDVSEDGIITATSVALEKSEK